MINEKALLGYPLNFKNKIWIYPPLVKDMVGNDKFAVYLDLLTKSQEDVEDLLEDKKDQLEFMPTPFEFLLANCYHNKDYARLVKESFMYFIHQDVTFLYDTKTILIGEINEELVKNKSIKDFIFLTEEEFFDFQNLIRVSMGDKPKEAPNLNEDPRVKRIKALGRKRDKIKAKKGGGVSLGTNLVAICCMNTGINPLNIGELSYAAVRYLTQVYQNKEEYTLDIDSLLAGADSKKVKPKYWIRNLE